MRKFYILLLLCTSCTDNSFEEEKTLIPQSANTRTLFEDSAKDIAINFFTELKIQPADTLLEATPQSRAQSTDVTMTPIEYNGEIVFWVANNPNNAGYAILPADKRECPIYSFSTEGNFDYTKLSPAEKEQFDVILEQKYLTMKQPIYEADREWATIIGQTPEQLNSDTTYVVKYEFYPVKERSTRTNVGGRKNPYGIFTIYPRLYRNRLWKIYWPYDYDVPKAGHDIFSPNYEATPLKSITIATALYLDHCACVDKKMWDACPDKMQKGESTWLTKYLAKLNKDFGTYISQSQNILPAENLSKIPGVLSSLHGTRVQGPFTYKGNFASVLEWVDWLADEHFILYLPGVRKDKIDGINNAYLVDGYHEMYYKITVKKYFMSILYKTEVYHRYWDCFYMLNGYNTGDYAWRRYDTISSQYPSIYADYYFVLEPPCSGCRRYQ